MGQGGDSQGRNEGKEADGADRAARMMASHGIDPSVVGAADGRSDASGTSERDAERRLAERQMSETAVSR
jgi:hypothetical protein